MESLSIWDQKNRKFVRNGYRAGSVTIEFQRTKKLKITEHTLAEITFDFKKDLNSNRDEAISRDITKVGTSGFRYESVGNVYLPEGELIGSNSSDEFEILSHGTPVPGELENGNENCAIEGLTCADGTDTNCKPGKCKIGKLKKISNYKWKYTSNNVYGVAQKPVEYYVGGKQVVELKTIIRGAHINPDGTSLDINVPASKATIVYLPPQNYFEDAFSKDFIKFFNYTLDLDGTNTTSGIITTEEDFIKRVINLAYRRVINTEVGPMYSSLADSPLSQEVFTAVEDVLFNLDKVWKNKALEIMNLRWQNRFAKHETNREFITYVLRELRVVFSKCLQVTRSGIKSSRIRSISDENVRPIYLRLPAAALSYRPEEQDDIIIIGDENERFNISISALEVGTMVSLSDRSIAYQFLPRVISDETERRTLGMSPVISERTKSELYSPKDTQSWYRLPEDRLPKTPIAKWILAGADEFLREKKHDIENFYYTYLDPTECSPKNLDWLAQHVGLSAPLWNTQWSPEHKRTLIKNALGWFEESLTQNIGNKTYKTIKGEVLDLYPFKSLPWRSSSVIEGAEELDISEVDLSKVSSIGLDDIDSLLISNRDNFTSYSGISANNFSVNKEEWDGLIESKGSILTLVFLFSLFGIKGHVAEELDASNSRIRKNTFNLVLRPKTGLRAQEINAPYLLPVKFNMAQVGTQEDYSIRAYDNQLVAGQTAIADETNSKNLFFRLPYYYNRDGITWNAVETIAKYWINASLNAKVQYAYLSADLWNVGDAFFEPNIINTFVLNQNVILLENENGYITTEDGVPIILD